MTPIAAEPAFVILRPRRLPSSSVRQSGWSCLTRTCFRKPSAVSFASALLKGAVGTFSGTTARPSLRWDAEERMTSWTSLSFGVFAFGMMPSVAVHGSTRRHHRDPANRLSAAGFRKALRPIRLASAQPGRHPQQRSVRAAKPVLSAERAEVFLALFEAVRVLTREKGQPFDSG